jgi:hypothetical protein
MNELPRSPKLKPQHVDRVALVYVRQSAAKNQSDSARVNRRESTTGGGNRTHTPLTRERILSPQRLPHT